MPPKKPSKAGKRQSQHAAAGGATREEREKEEEEKMKKQVAMEMNRINGEKRGGDDYTSRIVRAKKIASIRSQINWNLQYSVATLPRFGLPINCTVQTLKDFFQDRRIRYRMLGSYHLADGIVVTAPETFRTYHLIDMLSDDPDTPQKSIVQFIIDEYSNYLSAFRPTPEDDPYKSGGFYLFVDLEAPLPIWFEEDGENFIMPWASVGYDKLDEVEVSKGFLKRMTDKLLNNFTPDNYKKKIPGRKAMLETPIVVFGEGQRSREVEDFICVNFDSPVPIFVTFPLNTLIHSWSELSKVALHFLIAIVELQIGAREARHSFLRARREMYLLFDELSKLNLKSVLLEFEENGVFSLKSLLGRYLLLVKYEPGLVARLIVRGVDNFTGEYDRYSNDAEPTLEGLEPILMLQQQEEDREVTGHEEKKKLEALVNKLRTQVGEEEYLRWVNIKESGKDLLAELMK